MAPPISAAAILSRNEERTQTNTSKRNGPFQSFGRYRGRTSGTPDSSNIFASIANPKSNPARLRKIPHSPCLKLLCMICWPKGVVPKRCLIIWNPGSNANLNTSKTASPITATQKVCLLKTATPASISANIINSIRTGPIEGTWLPAAINETGEKRIKIKTRIFLKLLLKKERIEFSIRVSRNMIYKISSQFRNYFASHYGPLIVF